MSKPVYRMSGAGDCARAITAQRLNYKGKNMPDFVLVAAEEGNLHEPKIVEKLESEYEVFNRQSEVKINFPAFTLLGHIDGMVKNNKIGTALLEIKTMSQFQFHRWQKDGFSAFPKYSVQLACYMEATGLRKALYVVKNRSSGYIDKTLINNIPINIELISNKFLTITMAVQSKRLCIAEYNSDDIECRQCLFSEYCAPISIKLSPIQENELLEAAKLWRNNKELEKRSKKSILEASAIFKHHLIALEKKKVTFNDLNIQLQDGKENISIEKLKQRFTAQELLTITKTGDSYIVIRDNRRNT